MANDLVIIDLSHHNTVTDFAAVKRAGVIGIIHKATEGTSFVDKTFATRRTQANAAGLKWASYHFLKHGNVDAQMTHYLGTAAPVRGERVVIDYEDEACTLDDLRAAVKRIRTLRPDVQIAIYAGHLIKQQLGNKRDELLATCSLWIAHYTSASSPSWPTATWPVWSLWQYSDGQAGGSPKDVPGINAPHDCNAFNGSRTNCEKWMGPVSSAPAEPEKFSWADWFRRLLFGS